MLYVRTGCARSGSVSVVIWIYTEVYDTSLLSPQMVGNKNFVSSRLVPRPLLGASREAEHGSYWTPLETPNGALLLDPISIFSLDGYRTLVRRRLLIASGIRV